MATETLRPNATGDETAIPNQEPSSTYHWDKVDEEVSDELTTYIWTGVSYQRDLYNFPSLSVGNIVINSIKIVFLVRRGSAVDCRAQPSQKSGTTVTDGTEVILTALGEWETFSQTYTTNPATGNAYTWEEIVSLQVGIRMGVPGGNGSMSCTQIYIEIDYTPIIFNPYAIMFGV